MPAKQIMKGSSIATIGHSLKFAINHPFDEILYPAVMVWLGNIKGGLVMILLSVVLNYILIRLYDWSKTDWLYLESLKSSAESDATGKWERFFRNLVQWSRNKGKVVTFLALCADDPITVVLYFREGSHKYDGLSRRDWEIFILATIVANLYWIVFWSAIINFFKWLF